MKSISLLTAVGALALAAGAAQAIPALSYSANTGDTLSNPPFTLGWSFTVNSAVKVSALGFFDDSLDGLAESHDLGLWNSNGTLLASATVAAGTVDPLDANFRYVAVSPVTLAAGAYTVGALFSSGADPVVFSGGSGTVSTVAAITYTGATYAFGGTLSNPTAADGSGGFFGPNFETAAVPEPAAWVLMVAGFGIVGAAARRRPAPLAA